MLERKGAMSLDNVTHFTAYTNVGLMVKGRVLQRQHFDDNEMELTLSGLNAPKMATLTKQ